MKPPRSRKAQKILVICLLIWAIVATSLSAYYYLKYREASVASLAVVDIYIDYGNGTIEARRGLELRYPNCTAYDALRAVAQVKVRVYPSMGVYVECINGVCEDPAKGLYWLYYVNGKLAPTSCDSYFLRTGDVVTWNYTSPPW